MEPKIFSVEDANRLLPRIQHLLKELRRLREAIESKKVEMDLWEIVGAQRQEGFQADLGTSKEMEGLNQLAVEFNRNLEILEEMGCQVKGLNEGLIDFFSVRDGRLVYLCWKEGEASIGSWHTLDGGFKGRQPL